MRILSIDPGITTGVALYGVDENFYTVFQTTSLQEIIWIMDTGLSPTDIVLIENFIGGGYRTNETTHTLKLLGFVENYAKYIKHAHVVIQTPQTRKAYVKQASDILEKSSGTPHAVDAFAHILAYIAKEKTIREPDPGSIEIRQV